MPLPTATSPGRTGYLPQSLVFPAVQLLVSHGGAGGTIGALMHGLPHLVIAGHGQSQVSNAEAVHRLGAGLRLREGERSDDEVTTAAMRLLGEPSFGAAARRIRDQLDQLPGADDALTLIEEEARS